MLINNLILVVMAKIFISHSSHDDEFVNDLASDLTILGHQPWTDDKQIHPGDRIDLAIEKGLKESRYCIIVLSEKAIESKWVENEFKEKYWDLMNGERVKIIPVFIEKCKTPYFLRRFHYADFTKSYAVGFSFLTIAFSGIRPRMPDILDFDFIGALEHTAKKHQEDHIRLACVHTVWSFRPDRAKPILEDATRDFRDINREHAKMLLKEFY